MLSPLGCPCQLHWPCWRRILNRKQRPSQQAGEDACRKPLVVEAAGPIANRVAVAMYAAWRERNAIAIQQTRLGGRETGAGRRMAGGRAR